MKALLNSIAARWCRFAHDDLMLPIRGFVTCRRCQRRFSVPWEAK